MRRRDSGCSVGRRGTFRSVLGACYWLIVASGGTGGHLLLLLMVVVVGAGAAPFDIVAVRWCWLIRSDGLVDSLRNVHVAFGAVPLVCLNLFVG